MPKWVYVIRQRQLYNKIFIYSTLIFKTVCFYLLILINYRTFNEVNIQCQKDKVGIDSCQSKLAFASMVKYSFFERKENRIDE